MDKAIASENAHQFIKMLVELGGVRYVNQDHIICNSANDDPVGVKTGTPPKEHPVAIFKEGMKIGDYVVLNPFTDVLGNSPERALFINWMCAFPGAIIYHIISKMIEIGIDKEKDPGYKANKFISKWIDKMDHKMLEEAGRIRGRDWGVIFYDRNARIAQLQVNVGREGCVEEYRSKIRKSTWPIFTEMIKTILKLGTKKPESIMYESKVVSIPKVDAILNLLIDILDRLNDPIKEFTDVKIPLEELKEHMKHLDAYREATKWFASATVSPDAEKNAGEVAAPWDSNKSVIPNLGGATVDAAPVGSNANSVSDAMTIANLTPVGVIYNESFGRSLQNGVQIPGAGMINPGMIPMGYGCNNGMYMPMGGGLMEPGCGSVVPVGSC